MMDGDPGVFFGPLSGETIAQMPGEVLPERLSWGVDRYADVGPYAELRLASAESLREGEHTPEDEDFGRELLMLEPLLDGALRYETPSPAGMGLVAWDKAVPDVPEAGAGQEKKAKRMARRLFPDDEEEIVVRRPEPDPDALRRAADLVEAIGRVKAVEAGTEDKARRERLVNLRVDLQRRLARERRHDAALDRLLPQGTPLDAETAALLRSRVPGPASEIPQETGPATVVRIERETSAENPYLRALAEAESRLAEPLALDAAAAEPEPARLAEVRDEAARAVSRVASAASGSPAAQKAAERARRLFAEEIALSGGRPSRETLALRRELAAHAPTAAPSAPARPEALVAAPGLPEVPVMSSRGQAARVVGAVSAGAAVQVTGPAKGGFVPVVIEGRKGWVPEALLQRAGDRPASWPQPLTPPSKLGPLPPPARPAAPTRLGGVSGGPVDVRHVLVEAAASAGPETAKLVSAAIEALPDVLGSRMRGRPPRRMEQQELSLVLEVPASARDANVRGRIIADQVADAIVKAGISTLDTLKLQLRVREVAAEPTPEVAFDRLTAGDDEGLARALAGERRTLDAATRNRLASFFGHDFNDVMVFAGPMSGAMARSLSAEAFTHGKLVFFDPKHFRPDTPHGEALLAHELTHTRQAGSDADVKAKEAQALAAEARFLDWVAPGGAPLAKELDEAGDATSPSAQAAADAGPARRGVHRAEAGRQVEASEGPRADTAKFEERVKNVLSRVHEMLEDRGNFEADRIGRLVRAGVMRF